MSFTVPVVPAGCIKWRCRLFVPGESDPRTSNVLALVVGPEITNAMPITVGAGRQTSGHPGLDRTAADSTGQSVGLLVGTRDVSLRAITVATGTFNVAVADAPTGESLLRVRVDGIDSPIIDRSAVPPVFPQLSGDDHMKPAATSVNGVMRIKAIWRPSFRPSEAASWGRT